MNAKMSLKKPNRVTVETRRFRPNRAYSTFAKRTSQDENGLHGLRDEIPIGTVADQCNIIGFFGYHRLSGTQSAITQQ